MNREPLEPVVDRLSFVSRCVGRMTSLLCGALNRRTNVTSEVTAGEGSVPVTLIVSLDEAGTEGHAWRQFLSPPMKQWPVCP